MSRISGVAAVLVLAACGAPEPTTLEPQPGPYSQDATADCLDQAGYEFEIGHGDPPSMRAEDIVFSIWFEDLSESWIDFYHPSKKVPPEGEPYDNAVVFLDQAVSTDDRDKIIDCLR